MNNAICIGLFGTCGDSTWRKAFIEKYEKLGLGFFNPQVPHWDPSCAEKEAQHLATHEIILYPILGESFGTGSLAESGFAVVQTLKGGTPRHILFFVDEKADAHLHEENPQLAKESDRARALIRAHLRELHLPTVHLCESLEEMLELSIKLAQAA